MPMIWNDYFPVCGSATQMEKNLITFHTGTMKNEIFKQVALLNRSAEFFMVVVIYLFEYYFHSSFFLSSDIRLWIVWMER